MRFLALKKVRRQVSLLLFGVLLLSATASWSQAGVYDAEIQQVRERQETYLAIQSVRLESLELFNFYWESALKKLRVLEKVSLDSPKADSTGAISLEALAKWRGTIFIRRTDFQSIRAEIETDLDWAKQALLEARWEPGDGMLSAHERKRANIELYLLRYQDRLTELEAGSQKSYQAAFESRMDLLEREGAQALRAHAQKFQFDLLLDRFESLRVTMNSLHEYAIRVQGKWDRAKEISSALEWLTPRLSARLLTVAASPSQLQSVERLVAAYQNDLVEIRQREVSVQESSAQICSVRSFCRSDRPSNQKGGKPRPESESRKKVDDAAKRNGLPPPGNPWETKERGEGREAISPDEVPASTDGRSKEASCVDVLVKSNGQDSSSRNPTGVLGTFMKVGPGGVEAKTPFPRGDELVDSVINAQECEVIERRLVCPDGKSPVIGLGPIRPNSPPAERPKRDPNPVSPPIASGSPSAKDREESPSRGAVSPPPPSKSPLARNTRDAREMVRETIERAPSREEREALEKLDNELSKLEALQNELDHAFGEQAGRSSSLLSESDQWGNQSGKPLAGAGGPSAPGSGSRSSDEEAKDWEAARKQLLDALLGAAGGVGYDGANFVTAMLTGEDLLGQPTDNVDKSMLAVAVILGALEPAGAKGPTLRAIAKAVEKGNLGAKAAKGLAGLAGAAPKVVDKLASKSPKAAEALGNALAKGGKVVQRSAEEVNASHVAKGNFAPFKAGTNIAAVTLEKDAPDVKFFRATKKGAGGNGVWATMEDPSKYPSKEAYMDAMGLDKNNPPGDMWFRTGKAGDTFNMGEVAPVDSWGARGGGTQVEFSQDPGGWQKMEWPWERP